MMAAKPISHVLRIALINNIKRRKKRRAAQQ